MYTHLLGVIFAFVAFPLLFLTTDYGNSEYRFVSLLIYSASFIFLYIASTIYHYSVVEHRKFMWRKIDHISIYFMISGSYVPFMLEYIEHAVAFPFLVVMYSLVFIGSLLKIWFTGRFEFASVVLYIFLGWMVLFIARSFFTNASYAVSSMVVAGGIAYMAGVYFYMNDTKKYYHAIWHIFVLLGSIFHFSGVFLIG